MTVDGGVGRFAMKFRYREPLPASQEWRTPAPGIDEDCLEVEAGVAYLMVEHRSLGVTVALHFRDAPHWSAAVQAASLGICERSLWHRLNRSYGLLLDFFNDRAAGVPSPAMQRLQVQKIKRAA